MLVCVRVRVSVRAYGTCCCNAQHDALVESRRRAHEAVKAHQSSADLRARAHEQALKGREQALLHQAQAAQRFSSSRGGGGGGGGMTEGDGLVGGAFQGRGGSAGADRQGGGGQAAVSVSLDVRADGADGSLKESGSDALKKPAPGLLLAPLSFSAAMPQPGAALWDEPRAGQEQGKGAAGVPARGVGGVHGRDEAADDDGVSAARTQVHSLIA